MKKVRAMSMTPIEATMSCSADVATMTAARSPVRRLYMVLASQKAWKTLPRPVRAGRMRPVNSRMPKSSMDRAVTQYWKIGFSK